MSNGNCSQVCTNTNGSYFCECNTGYLLAEDDMTCNGECSSNKALVAQIMNDHDVNVVHEHRLGVSMDRVWHMRVFSLNLKK